MRTGSGMRVRGFVPALSALGLLLALSSTASASMRRSAPPGPAPAATPTRLSMIQASEARAFTPEAAVDAARIALNNGIAFDTRAGEPPLDPALKASSYGPGPGYHLVQFRGPITAEQRAQLEAAGARIVQYLPNYAYLVRADDAALGRARALAAVRWTGLYQPAYKLSAELAALPATAGTIDAKIQLFQDEDLAAASQALTEAGAHVVDVQRSEWNTIARATFDRSALPRVAGLRAVQWIEVFRLPVIDNSTAQWITQTHISNNRAVWTHGLQGEGQVLSTSDTGIRTSHNQFRDPAVTITSGTIDYPTHRKIIGYRTMPGATFGDENSSGSTYHGTHTAGTICGDDSYVGGASLLDGMALKAKTYFLDIGSGAAGNLTGIPFDLSSLYIYPWTGNAGGQAKICSNSWGAAINGQYDLEAMQADQFMWNHKDFLLFFSAGNSGSATGTVGSPGTAKNIVTVGGTDNTNGNTISSASSRGPALDGRIKPTIVAPGFSLNSASGASDTGYHLLGGTSMSSPCAAGNGALLRQYLTEGWYPSGTKIAADAIAAPSAAIVKALMVNSADPGPTFPGTDFGWGRIDDDSVLYFSGDTRDLAVVDQTTGVLTGEMIEYKVSVVGNTIPLKVTLVWTDFPGAVNAAKELVNDLNLTVVSPTSLTYLGNVLSGGQSTTGGTADNTNVEEWVRRTTPEIGTWTIRVSGQNVPVGQQPFALVVTGDLGRTLGLLTLNKPAYGPSETIGIRLEDTSPGLTMPTVSLTSPTGDAETVTLADQGGGLFTGSIPLLFGVITPGDGLLSVTNGDVVTATYNDASATPATVIATALVDATQFTISAAQATAVTQVAGAITWSTSENASSRVYYGTSPALGSSTTLDANLVIAHSVALTGLSPNTLYYYDVESQDARGNLVRADNGGLHFTFSTAERPDVYVVAGDQTYDLIDRDVKAFARHGWTMDYTFANAGDPPLGDKTFGLRSYPIVWWYTGIEQYPQVSDAQRTLWSQLHDSGARLAFASHDVVWDFIAPTSQGSHATLDRTNWVKNYLHEDFKNDPPDISFVGGLAGDPISNDYVLGIPYTEVRTGGACDEVHLFPGTGTENFVWTDDTAAADSIGSRWTAGGPLGSPDSAAWGGTATKEVVFNYEPMRLNYATTDDVTRGDVVHKAIVWLTGRDHPAVTLSSPTGGSTITTSPVSIAWTSTAFGGTSISSTTLQYSQDLGQSWTTIASGALTSPYSWDISGVLNSAHTRVRVTAIDNGTPGLHGFATSGDFALARSGGDFRGPVVVPGSPMPTPNPVTQPNTLNIAAAITDSSSGGSNIQAAEYSIGASPAAAGSGLPMSGSFGVSQNTSVSAAVSTGSVLCTSCTFWVRGQDAAGNWGTAVGTPFVVRAGVVAVGDGPAPRFELAQNAPNPVHEAATTIRFSLAAAGAASLRIFNTNGALVRTLFAAPLAAGPHAARWDGRDDGGRRVAPGVYYYKLETPAKAAVKKMVKID